MCSLDHGVLKQRGVLSQSTMKHDSTRELFEYWNLRRCRRPVAARSDIDQTDIRNVSPDAFMLSADFTDEIRFRANNAQTREPARRELKGESFKGLWANASRDQIDAILNSVIDENEAVVAGVLGRTEDGAEVESELLLLPLARHEGTRTRALGIIAPLSHPSPLTELDVRTLRNIAVEQSPPPLIIQARQEEPCTRHGFLVHRGGRELRPDERSS